MSRRVFLKSLTALLGGFSLPAIAHTKPYQVKWKTLQISPVAGFQYYQGETLWPQLDAGQFVTLMREADNPYDDRAVRPPLFKKYIYVRCRTGSLERRYKKNCS